MVYDPASRSKLNRHSLARFPEDTLFDRLARAVCEAECLPRKELYESWEFARRVRRRLRGGRIVDLASGHGLVAWALLLLDDRSPNAVAVDVRIPESAHRLRAVLEATWPRLAGRVLHIEDSLENVELSASDVVVSAHGCGNLTDLVIEQAIRAGAHLAVLPCCQAEAKSDTGGLLGWLDAAMAIDVMRAQRLRDARYKIITQTIPATITPKNRLLIGVAPSGPLHSE